MKSFKKKSVFEAISRLTDLKCKEIETYTHCVLSSEEKRSSQKGEQDKLGEERDEHTDPP